MAEARGLPWIWASRSGGAVAVRAALRPAELAYRAIVGTRNTLYDRGVLRTHAPALPALSIGNLTVGGTGKTPVAAWAAGWLRDRGAHPAVVLRGYGDDEPLVHARLSPSAPVVVSPDRVRGIDEARRRGADVAVLDDAFQHRRVRRIADWVLISADRWDRRRHLLPAGPWREPIGALARGTVAIITRKAASPRDAAAVADGLRREGLVIPVAIVHLVLDSLERADGGESRPIGSLRGAHVVLLSAIGDPAALASQLAAEGASVRPRIFRDHHDFTDAELAHVATAAGGDMVVCTLKEAVRIGSRWPRGAPPLWYVSQRVSVEDGADVLASSLDAVLRARTATLTVADPTRPSP